MKPERLRGGKQVSHVYELCNCKLVLGTIRADKPWEPAAPCSGQTCREALPSIGVLPTGWALAAHLAGKEGLIRPRQIHKRYSCTIHMLTSLPKEKGISNSRTPFCATPAWS